MLLIYPIERIPVASPTATDGIVVVAFMTHRIAQINLRDPVR